MQKLVKQIPQSKNVRELSNILAQSKEQFQERVLLDCLQLLESSLGNICGGFLIDKITENLHNSWRISRCRCSLRKGVLRNFAKFTGKHLCQGLFFNKVAGLRSATLLKKRLWYKCFPVNLAKFLRTCFLQNTSGRLLL